MMRCSRTRLVLAATLTGAATTLLAVGGCSARAVADADIVKPGLDVLLDAAPDLMIGKRLGLITNRSGVDRHGRRGADLLAARTDLELVTLFAFEHGLAGTAPRPFEQLGAPWLRAEEVAAAMDVPGVELHIVSIPIAPSAPRYGGDTLPGLRLVVTDREAYRPVATVLRLLEVIHRLHPQTFTWAASIDRLAGTDRVREAVEAGEVGALLGRNEREAAEFLQRRAPFLLYH